MAADGSRGQPRLLCVPSIFDGDHLTNAAIARKRSVGLLTRDLDSVGASRSRRSTELIGIESDDRMVSSVCPQGTTLLKPLNTAKDRYRYRYYAYMGTGMLPHSHAPRGRVEGLSMRSRSHSESAKPWREGGGSDGESVAAASNRLGVGVALRVAAAGGVVDAAVGVVAGRPEAASSAERRKTRRAETAPRNERKAARRETLFCSGVAE